MSDILKAVKESRQSKINWGEAISRRVDLQSISTSIQFSVNILKKRIDALVEQNNRELLTLSVKVEDVSQSESDLDPFDFNIVDFEELAAQSNRDLKDAKEKLETFSSLDGAIIQLTGSASTLNGSICWNDVTNEKPKKEDGAATGTSTDISFSDARRILGYLLTVVPVPVTVPKPPQPAIRPVLQHQISLPTELQAIRRQPNSSPQHRPETTNVPTLQGRSSASSLEGYYEPISPPRASAPPVSQSRYPSSDRFGSSYSNPFPSTIDERPSITHSPPHSVEEDEEGQLHTF